MLPGIAESLGLALGGINGKSLAGISYPEKAIIWDGEILQKKVQELLQLQTESVPLRTADLPNGFESSLASTSIEKKLVSEPSTYTSPIGAHPLW